MQKGANIMEKVEEWGNACIALRSLAAVMISSAVSRPAAYWAHGRVQFRAS